MSNENYCYLTQFYLTFDFQQITIYNILKSVQQVERQDKIKFFHELKNILESLLPHIYNQLMNEELAWEDYKTTLYFANLRKDNEEMRRRRLEEMRAFRESL